MAYIKEEREKLLKLLRKLNKYLQKQRKSPLKF